MTRRRPTARFRTHEKEKGDQETHPPSRLGASGENDGADLVRYGRIAVPGARTALPRSTTAASSGPLGSTLYSLISGFGFFSFAKYVVRGRVFSSVKSP